MKNHKGCLNEVFKQNSCSLTRRDGVAIILTNAHNTSKARRVIAAATTVMKMVVQAVTTTILTRDGITKTVAISRVVLGRAQAAATVEVEDMSQTAEEGVDEELIEATVVARINILKPQKIIRVKGLRIPRPQIGCP